MPYISFLYLVKQVHILTNLIGIIFVDMQGAGCYYLKKQQELKRILLLQKIFFWKCLDSSFYNYYKLCNFKNV